MTRNRIRKRKREKKPSSEKPAKKLHGKIKHNKGILEEMKLILKIHRNLSGNKTEWDCHYIITGIITGKKNVLL